MQARFYILHGMSAQQLEAKESELRELGLLRGQLAAREESEERLLTEREDLAARLSSVEHQLATQRGTPSEEQEVRLQELAAREGQATRELQEQVGTRFTLCVCVCSLFI